MKKSILLFLAIVALITACKKDNDPAPLQAPVATDASDVTNTGFTANWNTVSGANDYEVDVATDNSFNNIINSLQNVGGPTFFDNLEDNTEYFYRVRATTNGANASTNSNTISVITMPDAPVATAATNITNSGFTANWNAVDGLTDYVLYVSLNNIPATPPSYIPGYNGLPINGTSHTITGLTSGTIYYYAVRTKVDARVSDMSNSIQMQTNN